LAKSDPLLSVDDIHTYYDESYVLQGVDLDMAAGKIVALLGRNGMGKTTFIRSVAGLTPPRRGTITFKGNAIVGYAPYKIAQLGMALVPQGRRGRHRVPRPLFRCEPLYHGIIKRKITFHRRAS
jgi:branched-chain amino acid transport system ATP-binding protein